MTPSTEILRREHALKLSDCELDLCFEEKRVSQASRFVDPVWILSAERSIHWRRLPDHLVDVDLGAFESLMVPVRRLAYLVLVEEELSAASVYMTVQHLKLFVCWMLSKTVPITRFRDVTNSDIRLYLEYFSLRPSKVRINRRRRIGASELIGRRTIRHHGTGLLRLYHYRHRIGDGLNDFRVLLDESTNRDREDFESKTDPIPDGDFQKLLGAAIRFVDENAVGAIRDLRKFIVKERILEVHEAMIEVPEDDLTARRRIKVAEAIRLALQTLKRGRWLPARVVESLSPQTIALMTNTSVGECAKCLRENRPLRRTYVERRKATRPDTINWDSDNRNTRIRLLQIACFIIIAASTGMRLGELLAIRPGCLVRRKKRGVTLYWVKSTLSKTSVNQGGEPAAWLCGELGAKALSVLEELYTVLPTATVIKAGLNTSRPDSLFRTYVWDAVTLEARPINYRIVIQKVINLFVEEMCSDVGYIHTHQFRRSFARNIIRWTNTPILALQRHFKHWSLLMTDYYIGSDSQLMELFYREQLEASQARLRQILSGQCGGPGGIILQKRLVKMLDLGELPNGFRGTKRETAIESLVDEMSRDGIFAYKCADFTTCLYVPGVAKCGEDGPKEHDCHPTECINSHILLEDVPFYLRNIAQNGKVFQQLTSTEKAGPYGLFVLTRIRNDVAAIRPLARLYHQKLVALQEHQETGDKLSQPPDWWNHISEEMQVLESVLVDIDAKKQEKAKRVSRLEAKARRAHA